MQIGQVFHLTPLVHHLDAATERFEMVFGPHVWYRGYDAAVNERNAALMAISAFVIEPMAPRPGRMGGPPTTHRRYLDRFGEGIHSLAVYFDGIDELKARLEAHDVRAPDGGMSSTIFTHPKDFPGLIEFYDRARDRHVDTNPRLHPGYNTAYWSDLHGLTIQGASHVTLVVADHRAAAKRYAEVVDSTVLPDQRSRTEGADSSFVTFGPDTMIELAQPRSADSPAGRQLATVGESWYGVTFKVRDLDSTRHHLSVPWVDAPHTEAEGTIRLDRTWMFGAEYAFTQDALVGDPRF